MEPKRKKTVQLMIDGRGPFPLHLELGRFEKDDVLAIDLVDILTCAIQRRPCDLDGIQWDEEDLRERDASRRRLAEMFGCLRSPRGAQRAVRRRASRRRTLEQPKEA